MLACFLVIPGCLRDNRSGENVTNSAAGRGPFPPFSDRMQPQSALPEPEEFQTPVYGTVFAGRTEVEILKHLLLDIVGAV